MIDEEITSLWSTQRTTLNNIYMGLTEKYFWWVSKYFHLFSVWEENERRREVLIHLLWRGEGEQGRRWEEKLVEAGEKQQLTAGEAVTAEWGQASCCAAAAAPGLLQLSEEEEWLVQWVWLHQQLPGEKLVQQLLQLGDNQDCGSLNKKMSKIFPSSPSSLIVPGMVWNEGCIWARESAEWSWRGVRSEVVVMTGAPVFSWTGRPAAAAAAWLLAATAWMRACWVMRPAGGETW